MQHAQKMKSNSQMFSRCFPSDPSSTASHSLTPLQALMATPQGRSDADGIRKSLPPNPKPPPTIQKPRFCKGKGL